MHDIIIIQINYCKNDIISVKCWNKLTKMNKLTKLRINLKRLDTRNTEQNLTKNRTKPAKKQNKTWQRCL